MSKILPSNLKMIRQLFIVIYFLQNLILFLLLKRRMQEFSMSQKKQLNNLNNLRDADSSAKTNYKSESGGKPMDASHHSSLANKFSSLFHSKAPSSSSSSGSSGREAKSNDNSTSLLSSTFNSNNKLFKSLLGNRFLFKKQQNYLFHYLEAKENSIFFLQIFDIFLFKKKLKNKKKNLFK